MTRGFIHYRMNNHEAALSDLTQAIASFEHAKQYAEEGERERVLDKRRFEAFRTFKGNTRRDVVSSVACAGRTRPGYRGDV